MGRFAFFPLVIPFAKYSPILCVAGDNFSQNQIKPFTAYICVNEISGTHNRLLSLLKYLFNHSHIPLFFSTTCTLMQHCGFCFSPINQCENSKSCACSRVICTTLLFVTCLFSIFLFVFKNVLFSNVLISLLHNFVFKCFAVTSLPSAKYSIIFFVLNIFALFLQFSPVSFYSNIIVT